ncbi:NADH dehydrogenase [ubiquinone] 1 beta subcomplex subunit 2, mitochondrial-like [Hylaeus volcanicus]|uniref:NADH dehydrogenase [ubiquinone] 1 beta subcomplex subunit 2, mitochondrial-like n=1 Tax=Hylaeus volcanicus TaxID=313075 RepID=UPI0023B7F424|nr:NADH dehydrogenase [ubiquinone] 1 beta subcomplex subunit 2, mitochondrial-like [Hylaeus volcanicus]
MLISRGAAILKNGYHYKQAKSVATNLKFVRFSHANWCYRAPPPPGRLDVITAEVTGGIVWWWTLWHLYYGWEVLLKGEIPAPIPEHWTDEELGIPPDDDE